VRSYNVDPGPGDVPGILQREMTRRSSTSHLSLGSGVARRVRPHMEFRDPYLHNTPDGLPCSTPTRRNVRRDFGGFIKHEGRAAPPRLCVDTHACARTSRKSDRRTSSLCRPERSRTHAFSAGPRSGRRTRAAALSAPLFGRYRSAVSLSLRTVLSHTPLAVERSRCSPITAPGVVASRAERCRLMSILTLKRLAHEDTRTR